MQSRKLSMAWSTLKSSLESDSGMMAALRLALNSKMSKSWNQWSWCHEMSQKARAIKRDGPNPNPNPNWKARAIKRDGPFGYSICRGIAFRCVTFLGDHEIHVLVLNS